MRASPVGQRPSVRHSAKSSGPAARWIAPSTPPPPSSEEFAALTMASSASVVMSATQISSRVLPTSAFSGKIAGMASRLARPLGLRFGRDIDGAAHADIVEMGVEEFAGGALAAVAQHLEEAEIRVLLGIGGEALDHAFERDPVHIDAPVFAR